jgi:hypothetical protein
MINMTNIFIGAIGMWFILGALFTWFEGAHNRTLYKILECVIALPWVLSAVISVVVCYPIACLWKFFRNAVKGVSVNCWKRAQIKRYLKLGNFRLCYDATAKALCNKLFLVRIVKPAEQINHKSKR